MAQSDVSQRRVELLFMVNKFDDGKNGKERCLKKRTILFIKRSVWNEKMLFYADSASLKNAAKIVQRETGRNSEPTARTD